MPRHATMENFINSQVKYWQVKKKQIDTVEKKIPLPFVTISREYGSGGYDVGTALCEIMNTEFKSDPQWAAYDRQLLDKVMEDLGLSSSLADTLTSNVRDSLTNIIQTSFSKFPPQVAVYRKLAETVRMLAYNGNVVIIGRAGNVITKDFKYGYHVRMVAPLEMKISNIINKMKVSRKEAEKLITEKSAQREAFIREYVKFDVADPHNYDLIINNSAHNMREAAEIIIAGIKAKGLIK